MAKVIITIEDGDAGAIDVKFKFTPKMKTKNQTPAQAVAMALGECMTDVLDGELAAMNGDIDEE